MAQRIQLKAQRRSGLGTAAVKKSRRAGKIPAVLYGHGEPQALEFSAVELVTALNAAHSENVLVDLEISGETSAKKHLALIKEIQQHPIQDKVLHIDLNEIDPNQTIHAEVPVEEFGEAIGVKNGGVLDHLMRHVRVECLPANLPSAIRVDITALDIGGAIHVSDLPKIEGVTVTNAPDLPVFMVHAPRVEEVAATAAAAAEPEVINQKKDAGAEADKKEK